MLDDEFKNDIVFARFLNYMQIALLHRKLDYGKHLEVIKKRDFRNKSMEWSRNGLQRNRKNLWYVRFKR